MKIQRTVETTAAPGPVFAYLSDFTNTNEWDPGTISTERVEGDGGVGTVYHNVSEFNGNKSELRYEVVELVADRKIALMGEGKSVHADDTMELAPSGTGTRVTYTADIRFKGLLKVAEPFLGKAFKKLGDEAEEGLNTALAKL